MTRNEVLSPVPDGERVAAVATLREMLGYAKQNVLRPQRPGIDYNPDVVALELAIAALLSQPAAQQDAQYHSGEGCCADPKCGNDCHHSSAEPIDPPAAQQDEKWEAALEAYTRSISTQQDALRTAAMKWWEGKRPIRWTRQEHIDCPLVNTTTDREQVLANACAALAATEDKP